MLRTSLTALTFLALTTAGCADKKPAKEPVSQVPVTAAKVPNVHVGDDIVKLCKIQFGDAQRAPKFDYDQSELLASDRDVLEQVGKCMTTGPLKDRHVSLVGRADPRGESEYNMVLGDHRADNVRDYLVKLGVASDALHQTSRGELDASGTDEDSWRMDRRVDLLLLQ